MLVGSTVGTNEKTLTNELIQGPSTTSRFMKVICFNKTVTANKPKTWTVLETHSCTFSLCQQLVSQTNASMHSVSFFLAAGKNIFSCNTWKTWTQTAVPVGERMFTFTTIWYNDHCVVNMSLGWCLSSHYSLSSQLMATNQTAGRNYISCCTLITQTSAETGTLLKNRWGKKK